MLLKKYLLVTKQNIAISGTAQSHNPTLDGLAKLPSQHPQVFGLRLHTTVVQGDNEMYGIVA